MGGVRLHHFRMLTPVSIPPYFRLSPSYYVAETYSIRTQ